MPDSRFAPSNDYRVRPYRPLRTAVLVLLLAAILAAVVWGAYRLGVRDGGYAVQQARATEAHLRIQIADLRDRVGKMSRRNTLLARSERIERDARQQLRGVIEERERKIASLQEELAFYRNIVSPSKMDPGLQIRRVSFDPITGVERAYRYELVLSQLNGGKRYASGQVQLRVDGHRAGEPATFGIGDLALDGSAQTKFRFKYFQMLTGRVRLPEDFEPGWLQVSVSPSNGFEPLEETYSWDSLLSGGA